MGLGITISTFRPVRGSRAASPREKSPTITAGEHHGRLRNCGPPCTIRHIDGRTSAMTALEIARWVFGVLLALLAGQMAFVTGRFMMALLGESSYLECSA